MTSDDLILIAIGSNLPSPAGNPQETVARALDTLQANNMDVIKRSAWYRTRAVPDASQPDFVNGVVAVRTTTGPRALLRSLHDIEGEYGRKRQRRWSARPLDLDLLAHGRLVLPDDTRWRQAADTGAAAFDQLWLPHPRMHKRRFVMEPLAEIAPDWRHPVLGLRAIDLLAELPENA